jgi:hypothetical protein
MNIFIMDDAQISGLPKRELETKPYTVTTEYL